MDICKDILIKTFFLNPFHQVLFEQAKSFYILITEKLLFNIVMIMQETFPVRTL